MPSWLRNFRNSHPEAEVGIRSPRESQISDGSLKYTGNQGGNSAEPTFQEASGAPVEANSPMGYSVSALTIMFLNINMMIGTGIFSTRRSSTYLSGTTICLSFESVLIASQASSILSGTGSIGLSLIYWTLGFFLCVASGAVYLEFTAYYPSRSGSEVAFLEQAYPRPSYFFPTTFAIQSVVFSFSSSNAIVLADYLFECAGTTGTDWQVKGVALAGYTIATLVLIFHTKFSYHLSNAIGVVKVALLLFIIIAGFIILSGGTRIEDPKANFRNSFEGTQTASAYGLTNALYRIIFSYGGYNNAFNVVNEIKNPVKSLKRNAALALFLVYVLYMLTNVSWYAGVSKYDLENSKLTTASLWFNNVLGSSNRVRGLNFLIALSAFGNMVSGSIGSARMIRECGRQGVLPWTSFWASTKPFGTPIGPYVFKWAITALIILAIPSGDAFNFIADLAILPSAAFSLAMAVGLYLVRYRRKRANLPEPEFKAWNVLVVFNVLVQAYLVVMPWYPPTGGKGDVSFWYGTYCVTGVAILIVCGIYYLVWAKLLPKWKGYSLRQEVVDLGHGAEAHRIAKVPTAQIASWEADHDAVGRLRQRFVYRCELGGEKFANTSSGPELKNAIVLESAASSV